MAAAAAVGTLDGIVDVVPADGTVLVPQPLLHYGAPAVIDPRG